MLPKRQEATDSFNNSNNVAEILCNVICLAKHSLMSDPGKGFAEPVSHGPRDPGPPPGPDPWHGVSALRRLPLRALSLRSGVC